jgi:hypothetical protein
VLRRFSCAALLIVTIAAAPCPPVNGQEAASCDARPTGLTITSCANDAIKIENCANRVSGVVQATYLTRAASEFFKAGSGIGANTATGRVWLTRATTLDQRVLNDPTLPGQLRERARRNQERANALLRAAGASG